MVVHMRCREMPCPSLSQEVQLRKEVFNYSRTYRDERFGRNTTSISKFKAVRDFIKKQESENTCGDHYQILENTAEFVDASAVVGGKYHPELVLPAR
jgi:hypothetical protein